MEKCPCGAPATRRLRLIVTTLDGSEPERDYTGCLCEAHYVRATDVGNGLAIEIVRPAVSLFDHVLPKN